MPIAPPPATDHLKFAYPPLGWVMIAVVLAYLLFGTLSHDPWKGDDAVNIGVIVSMLHGDEWLVPQLAGLVYTDYPPLYHWVGRLTATLFGWLLPLHDAARLASAVFGAALLAGMAATARQLHDRESASVCALLGIGSLGFLVHVHEAQPMLAVVAATTLAYAGYVRILANPWQGALLAGAGLGLAHLAGGFNSLLYAAPLALLLPWIAPDWRTRPALAALLGSLLLGALITVGHVLLLWSIDPAACTRWLASEMSELSLTPAPRERLSALAATLPWYTWPALPLSLWTLWRERRNLRTPPLALPLTAFLLVLLIAALTGTTRGPLLMPIVPPLALLAVAGVPSMRRGLANAFDWFAMMSFSFFMILVWVGWIAMVSGWPPRLARQVTRIEPGFALDFSLPVFALALALSVAWLSLIFSGARSPWRGTVNWAAGTLAFWGLASTLWMPWVNYGRSYRQVSNSLAHEIARQPKSCIVDRNLGQAQRASFYYFSNIVTHRDSPSLPCRLLLVQRTGRGAEDAPGEGWNKVWEDRRKGDRNEMYRLYVRN